MPKDQERVRRAEKTIDTFSKKQGRGRPESIPRSWVIGHADNSRSNLAQVWPQLCDPLLAAQTEGEVTAAFENYGRPYAEEYVPRLVRDILALIRDPSFPKRAKARIGFLADSLAGRPSVEFRTSRDICVKERAKQRARSPHKIIRKEFYIECECGYQGPALDDACRKCSAGIPITLRSVWGGPESF
jgi:hypothetical protein